MGWVRRVAATRKPGDKEKTGGTRKQTRERVDEERRGRVVLKTPPPKHKNQNAMSGALLIWRKRGEKGT